MTKSDKSIHNICIASIKRSTIKPYDFKWTNFYDSNLDFNSTYPELLIEFAENELIISSTVIDMNNYSILTTKRLYTIEKGILNSGDLINAIDKFYGEFKGIDNSLFTFGLVQLESGHNLKYFIETGKASMVMIHGVRTVIRSQQMAKIQVGKVTKIWNDKSE